MSRGGTNYQSGAANPFEELVDDDAAYAQLQREVTSSVKLFSSNTNTLTKLVGSMKSGRQDAELRTRVHDLINQNKQLAKKTGADLKRMTAMKSHDAREQQGRRAAQSRLAQDFQTWMQKFQEIATLDLNKERKEAQSSAVAAAAPAPQKTSGGYGGGYHDDEDKGWNEGTAVARYEEQRQQQAQQDDIDFNEQIVRERNREIREIETAVVEVGQIFQDLAAMVNEQGVMVDNIEANISSAVEATSTGVVQLEGAEEYQIKARKKCACITIIVVVAVAVIVVIILFALKII